VPTLATLLLTHLMQGEEAEPHVPEPAPEPEPEPCEPAEPGGPEQPRVTLSPTAVQCGRHATLAGCDAADAVSYSEGRAFDTVALGPDPVPVAHNSVLLVPDLLSRQECASLIADVERHVSDHLRPHSTTHRYMHRMHTVSQQTHSHTDESIGSGSHRTVVSCKLHSKGPSLA
jgi:hypothetical protein